MLDTEDGTVLHVVYLTEMVNSVRMMPDGNALLVAGEQLLAVIDVRTGENELAMPLDEGAKCVCATNSSLVVSTGSIALAYGKAAQHFGWQEPPSFDFVSRLLQSDDFAVHCVTPLVAAHPLVVNHLDATSGKTVLQHAIECSGDEELIERLLWRAPEISMTRDYKGSTSLHVALALGRRKAVQLLLTAVTDGRVSLIPDSLEPILSLFSEIARKYPSEFLQFLALMPLDDEKQGVLRESEREAHIDRAHIRGSELRAPVQKVSFWADYFPHIHEQSQHSNSGAGRNLSRFDGVDSDVISSLGLDNGVDGSSPPALRASPGSAKPAKPTPSKPRSWLTNWLPTEQTGYVMDETIGRRPVQAQRVPFERFAAFYENVEASPLFLILQALSPLSRTPCLGSLSVATALLSRAITHLHRHFLRDTARTRTHRGTRFPVSSMSWWL